MTRLNQLRWPQQARTILTASPFSGGWRKCSRGGYDQVGRVLRDLVRQGQLLKLGYGVYARAIKSPLSGKPMPPKGLATLAEAVERLGIKTVPTRLEQDYNAGRTTQVPTGRVVGIQGRLRRKLGYNGITLSFERA